MATKTKTPTKDPIAVVLTDLHMDEDNISVIKSIFKQTIAIAKSLGLTEIQLMGDLFDSRKGQPQSVLTAFVEILDDCQHEGIKVIAIPGNHDKTDYASEKSFLDPYKKHPAFVLHSNIHFETIKLKKGEVEMTWIPFFTDEQYLKELDKRAFLKDLSETGQKPKAKVKSVLFTHIGVSGAVMNNGIAVATRVTADLLDEFDLTLIGHYHDPQQLSDKIKYVGASLQHNFGESPTKGATIVYADMTTELRELEFPRFINYEVDVKQLTAKDVEELKKEKRGSEDQIRVTLVGAEKDVKAYDATMLKNAGIDVKSKKDQIKQEDIEGRVEAFNDKSILGSFEAFCKKNNLNHPQGLTYLSKALGIVVEIEEEEEEDV